VQAFREWLQLLIRDISRDNSSRLEQRWGDDCDRWLERNRGVSFTMEGMMVTIPSAPESATAIAADNDFPKDGMIEEDYEELSQKELRLIFRGLCSR
jgi:hypothetical protein